MKEESTSLRLVLDTNVWLDWLVFDDPAVAPVKAAVAAGRAEVLMDEAVEAELARVLAYSFGIRTLTAEAQAACLAECRRIARRHECDATRDDGANQASPLLPEEGCLRSRRGGGSETSARASDPENAGRATAPPAEPGARLLPVCEDPDDQKFLDLALACGAAYLVTRDRDLLELARHRDPRPPFRIVTPQEFHAALKE